MGRKFGTSVLCAVTALAMTACAASDDAGSRDVGSQQAEETEEACVPGHQTVCACPSGGDGIQVCLPDGSGFEPCQCTPLDPGTEDPEEPCGDGVCTDEEDCHNCPKDCGICEPCDIAPSCSNAHVPPADLPHMSDLDVPKMDYQSPEQLHQRLVDLVSQAGPEIRLLAAALDNIPASGEHPFVTALREVFDEHPVEADALRVELSAAGMLSPAHYRAFHPEARLDDVEWSTTDATPPGGSMECGAPLLRVGVNRIKVHEEDDDWANDIVYCLIQAEAATGAEIRITPKTPNLDEGESYTYSLETGVFWGQQGPTTPAGNMLITYDCIEADTSSGYQDLVNAIGNAAGQIGDVVEGENGWIFDAASAVAPIVSAGLALNGDDHLFNAQQTIPLDSQLELTNGAYWTVRREGTHVLSDWDWELYIQAWGCAEYGEL